MAEGESSDELGASGEDAPEAAEASEGHAGGAAGRPSARRRRLRREELLDAADTVIRRVGLKASAALIAQEAGVTKPIIYRHFGDLQDLYRALAVRHHERLTHYLLLAREENRGLDRQGRYHSAVNAFFKAIEREPNLFRFLVQAPPESADHEGGQSWLTSRLAEQIGAYLARESGNPDSQRARAMGYAAAGAMTATGNWWLEERTIPRELMVDAITDLLVRGIPPAFPTGD